jgi:hypothetical protein
MMDAVEELLLDRGVPTAASRSNGSTSSTDHLTPTRSAGRPTAGGHVRHQLTTRFTIVVTVVLVVASLLWALLAGAVV